MVSVGAGEGTDDGKLVGSEEIDGAGDTVGVAEGRGETVGTTDSAGIVLSANGSSDDGIEDVDGAGEGASVANT